MSFIIDGSRSFLVAGTRGSGKTSFLGASMLEIMKKFRMALDPLVGILTMFYTVDRMYREERWLVEAFAYVPYQDGLLRYGMHWTPVGMVPKPIYRLIFGG